MNKTKVSAFTLTEIMVVLVITAIVVGLAFSVINMVQNNIQLIASNYKHKSEIQQLHQSLQIDFNRFRESYWDNKTETIILENPIREERYQIKEDSIYTSIKAYPLKVRKKVLYFKGEEVTKGRIDAIKIYFEESLDIQFVFISKHNDLSIYFEEWE